MNDLSQVESSVLTRLQADFPLHPRPFGVIGEDLGLSEENVLAVVRRLKENGILRDITGIFNGNLLGYHTALAAFEVPVSNVEKTAAIVGAHPGVGHNYERDGGFNLWFTLTVESEVPLEEEIDALAGRTGVGNYLAFRNEKTLKIGVVLPLGDGGSVGGYFDSSTQNDNSFKATYKLHKPEDRSLVASEKEIIRILQKDLPLEPLPFDALAERYCAPFRGTEVLRAARGFREQGILRRYAAILRHRKAGYRTNIMSAWRYGEGDDSRLLPFIREPRITHLYLRSAIQGYWEHNLFAMLHARSSEEAENLIARLSVESGLADYRLFPTKREFKKKKIEYLGERFSLLHKD